MALHGSPYGTEGWNGGSERVCVAAESSSQTEKLRSVAHDISQLTTASRGRCAPDTEETAPGPCGGVFFMDGRRRVDYVLVYHCKKRSSEHRLSIVSNGNVPVPCPTPSRRSAQPELVEAELEAGPEEGPGEAEKCLIREEFERGLQEEGLEIEHDKELRSVRFVRLHVPWATLSREAELLKIPVPTTTKYELKEKRGLAGLMNSFWEKINQPFQPAVPDPLAHTHSRVITQPFCRDKLHMFDMTSKNPLYDSATRGRIVFEILRRTTCAQTCQTMGINSLLAKGVYDAAFPLHDGDFDDKEKPNDRQLLHDAWANYGVFFKYQPVDLIRKYFGEKIGLYFAWLGVYTQLLIPASILGVLVFLYGFLTLDNNVPSQELCSAGLNITMCPLCDGVCDYWPLSSVCSTAQASYLFDNHATVAFAIFMSLWAAVFLEQWKRRQRCLQHSWDLSSMEDEEDELRPAYEDFLHRKQQKKGKKKKKEEPEGGSDDKGREKLLCAKAPQPPFMSESLSLKDRLPGFLINISSVLLMVGVTFSAVSGVILYRIIVFAVMSMNPDHEAKANVRVTVTTTAVIINLLVVLVLDEIYGAVAAWITELEIPKTEAEFEEHVILKAFLLKSMNAFAPVFYVAFFKGRFAGRPGDYVYVFKDFRMEECAPPGCLIEVCIQLGIIMLGKQLIQNNVFEVAIPKLKKMYRKYKEKQEEEEKQKEEESTRERQRWERDYSLEPYEGLSPEYMEMIIQYGFVTLFVASFPLAPVFALLNNVIEIRLDAAKFVTEIRRPDAVRAKEIGIWFDILSGISKFAVITNAFVISFTSDFIPRLVYQYLYSDTGSMHGFINNTLSYFNTSHFKPGTAPNDTLFDRELRICRYKDYRDPPWSAEAYQLSKQYWSVLAARLAFVIFFQNLAMFLSRLVAWLIPDVPRSLKEELKREKALLLELLLSEEMDRQRAQSQRPAKSDIIMKSPEEEEPESCGTAHTAEEPTDQSDDSQLAQSNNQSEKRVDTPSNTSEHELDAHCNEPIREQPEAHPFPKPSESVHSLSVVMETIAGPPDVEHAKPNSRQYEFTLDGPPIRDPDPKVKGRCRTLPPRCRLTEAAQSSTGTSHSTSFPHFSQSAALSHPLSKLDSQTVALSKQDIKSAALPRPPSKTELIASQTAALPRPPSKQDIIANNETEPPTHAQDTRVKGRCRTLPPTCRLIEAAQSSRGTSHSTSFPHLSQSAALSHPLFKPESQSPALPRPPSKPDESQDSAV